MVLEIKQYQLSNILIKLDHTYYKFYKDHGYHK